MTAPVAAAPAVTTRAARGAGATIMDRTAARRLTGRWGGPLLLGWFALLDIIQALGAWLPMGGLGGNVHIYNGAARVWLAGGDPWSVAYQTPFGLEQIVAPPPAIAPFLLTAWLPDEVAIVVWLVVGAAAGVYAIRRLGLPLWWLAFPPLFGSVFWGGADTVCLALLASGVPWLAGVIRVTFGPAMIAERRWRQLALAGAVTAASFLVMPWMAFIGHYSDIGRAAAAQAPYGGLSAASTPILVPAVVLALVALGWRRGWYLAVPALWPAAVGNYGLVALPVLASMPLVAAAVSVPLPWVGPSAIVAQAVWTTSRRRIRGRSPSGVTAPAVG